MNAAAPALSDANRRPWCEINSQSAISCTGGNR